MTPRCAIALAGALALGACNDPAIPGRAGTYAFADTVIIGVDTTVTLFRWPATRLPVRFWADPRGNMRFLVERAIAVWQDQFLYGELRGVVVTDSSRADVLVRWRDSVPPDVPPDTTPAPNGCGGVTTFDYDSAGLALAGPVHVALTVLTGGSPASPGQLQACVRRVSIHELGHSLGLLRHSLVPQDIMYAAPMVDYPSPFDRSSVEMLYHSRPTVQPPPQ
jgi:predicted Zn-dependent protease